MQVPNKLIEALLRADETQCLELLDIKTEELVERFEDKIKIRLRYLMKELEYLPNDDSEIYQELNFD